MAKIVQSCKFSGECIITNILAMVQESCFLTNLLRGNICVVYHQLITSWENVEISFPKLKLLFIV